VEVIQEILGYLTLIAIAVGLVGGCLHISEKVSRDQMEEELEMWNESERQWLQQLLEERRREFEVQIRREHT
jgi:hypothetical protein